MKRRAFLQGLLAAPVAITTPGLLMPVRPLHLPRYGALGFGLAQVKAAGGAIPYDHYIVRFFGPGYVDDPVA